jgi:hypothetical protein
MVVISPFFAFIDSLCSLMGGAVKWLIVWGVLAGTVRNYVVQQGVPTCGTQMLDVGVVGTLIIDSIHFKLLFCFHMVVLDMGVVASVLEE